MIAWLAGLSAVFGRPGRDDVRWMREIAAEVESGGGDEDAYLQGVEDALGWVLTGRSDWESDSLERELRRRSGADEDDEAPA